MKSRKLLLILFIGALMLGCQLFPGSGSPPRVLSEKVSKFPVAFDGGASVTTYYDVANCVSQGNAHFVAENDETCAVIVSFPMMITDTQGKCVQNGDTQAWLLKGTFKKAFQVCHPEICNDNADYGVNGTIKFFPEGTEETTVECVNADSGKTYVTIRLQALKP